MQRLACLVVAVFVGGCFDADGGAPEGDIECIQQPLELDGAGIRGVTIDPAYLDDECRLDLELDSTALRRGHFMGATSDEAGTTSSVELTLFDRLGNVVVAGWEVTVGVSEPRTYAAIEYAMEEPAIVELVLRVRSKIGPTTTRLSVSFFDPVE